MQSSSAMAGSSSSVCLAVSGSVAAVKAPELAGALLAAGVSVDLVLTEAAFSLLQAKYKGEVPWLALQALAAEHAPPPAAADESSAKRQRVKPSSSSSSTTTTTAQKEARVMSTEAARAANDALLLWRQVEGPARCVSKDLETEKVAGALLIRAVYEHLALDLAELREMMKKQSGFFTNAVELQAMSAEERRKLTRRARDIFEKDITAQKVYDVVRHALRADAWSGEDAAAAKLLVSAAAAASTASTSTSTSTSASTSTSNSISTSASTSTSTSATASCSGTAAAPSAPAARAILRIHRDADEWARYTAVGDDPVLHVELAKRNQLLLIAPLCANTLAQAALGLCGNLLGSVLRAWYYALDEPFAAPLRARYGAHCVSRPVLVAPAMNTFMWHQRITREHVETLEARGVQVVPPIAKKLACGDVGVGAMAEPADVARRALELLHEFAQAEDAARREGKPPFKP